MDYKIVSAPLSINDLDNDLLSKKTYLISYDNSSIKSINLIKYINNLGIIADIQFTNTTPISDIYEILEYYISSSYFNHFQSLNSIILNCIYYLKGYEMILPMVCSKDSIKIFADTHKEILQKWISFYDSYYMYMIMYIITDGNNIISKYSNHINNDNTLSPNVVSLLLDACFYDYFKTSINNDNINYWTYYYNLKYDNKTFNEIMLNHNNDFIITLASLFNKDYEIFKKIISKN